jgi:hypothetical protein
MFESKVLLRIPQIKTVSICVFSVYSTFSFLPRVLSICTVFILHIPSISSIASTYCTNMHSANLFLDYVIFTYSAKAQSFIKCIFKICAVSFGRLSVYVKFREFSVDVKFHSTYTEKTAKR